MDAAARDAVEAAHIVLKTEGRRKQMKLSEMSANVHGKVINLKGDISRLHKAGLCLRRALSSVP